MTNPSNHGGPTAPLVCLLIAAGLVGAGGCDKPKTMASSSATTVVASQQDNRVPGGETVEVPARTGSMASGTIGSSTVIGAPAKGETGAVPAH